MVLVPAAAICLVLLLLLVFCSCCYRKRAKKYMVKLSLLMFCLGINLKFLYLLFISEKFLIMTQPCTLEEREFLQTKCHFTSTAQMWLISTLMEATSLFTRTPHLCLSIPSRYFIIWMMAIYKETSKNQNFYKTFNLFQVCPMGRRGGGRRRRRGRRTRRGGGAGGDVGVDRIGGLGVQEIREEDDRAVADAETAIYLEILWADLSWLLHYFAARSHCDMHCVALFIQPVLIEYLNLNLLKDSPLRCNM